MFMFKARRAAANFILGILLGLLACQPVAAFPVEVVADTSYTSVQKLIEATKQTGAQLALVHSSETGRLAQALEYVKTAERWIATVNQYTRVIFEDVRRFTTLKGIMGVVEKQLGLNDDTLKALADIGQVVRGCLALKNQFTALVHTRLNMLRNIVSRAQNGIFDPQADLADLDDYLRNSIGRNAQDVIANRERLARFDNELERWTYDLGLLRAKQAALNKQRDETRRQLDAELGRSTAPRATGAAETGESTTSFAGRNSLSATAIESMKQTLLTIEGQLTEIEKQISELLSKITERYKRYHLKFDEGKITADTWEKEQAGWDSFMQLKEDAIERMVDNYGQQYDVPIQP